MNTIVEAQAVNTDEPRGTEDAELQVWPERAWLEILIRPRATVRAMVNTYPGRGVFLLLLINGLLSSFPIISTELSTLVLGGGASNSVAFLLGSIFGGVTAAVLILLLVFFLYAAAVSFIGDKLGGAAGAAEVRTVLGWSFVPAIIGNVITLVPTVVLGLAPALGGPIGALFLLLGGTVSVLVSVVAYIWQVVIVVVGVSEVNRFSVGRSLVAVLTPPAVLLAMLLALGIVITLFTAL